MTVPEEQIYYRKQSPSQTAETARKQIASQEMWGGPPSNFLSSHISAGFKKIPEISFVIARRAIFDEASGDRSESKI
jgi:hypothetical protein